MFIQAFPSGPYSTNAYVVSCEKTHHTIVIDPSPESHDSIIDYLKSNQLSCKAIWLTHSHWDHIADVKKLKNSLNVPVFIHTQDAPNLREPGVDGIPFWIPIDSVEPDFLFEDQTELQVGEHHFTVIHTPGHSIGSVCFYAKNDDILFSGDTLFRGATGNLSFLTSAPDLMPESLNRLKQLPPQTKVYPGHGPTTTIAIESKRI